MGMCRDRGVLLKDGVAVHAANVIYSVLREEGRRDLGVAKTRRLLRPVLPTLRVRGAGILNQSRRRGGGKLGRVG